jgi:glutaredoxin
MGHLPITGRDCRRTSAVAEGMKQAGNAGTEEETVAKSDCVVYCRSWCGDCMRAKAWLRANGIDYEEIDIELQPEAAERVREIAGKIVTPTFEIQGECVVNFDEQRLRELLLS